MTRRYTYIVAVAGIMAIACSEPEPEDAPMADPAEQPQPVDTAGTPVDTPEEQPPPAPEPLPEDPMPAPLQVDALAEEPWFPTATGTVEPGMTAEDVAAVWGPPALERSMGSRTFLYYRNGCERACGTFDVVMLEGNQVVDAIVRGQGHSYAGISSSPPGRIAEFTPPSPRPDTSGVIG